MKLKIGIIGLGVGEAHIKGYESRGLCEVVALCDFDQGKRETAEQKYPDMAVVEDANTILNDPAIDVVSIASYDNFHYEQIVTAIENDKHIFVEKPLCLFEKEAQHIRELLDKKPHLKMSSNLILRKCPRFMSLKDKIANGEFGALFHVEGDYNYGRLHKITEGWRGKMDFYSIIYGGGVHIIDLLLWLTGETVVEVAGFGNNIASQGSQFKSYDSATCILKFESGMTGKVSVHFGCVRPHFHSLSIFGKKLTFFNEADHALLYDSMDPKAEVHEMTEDYPGVHKGDLIASFVRDINEGTPGEVTKEDVFRSMSICFAMEEAINTEKIVKVSYI